MSVFAIRSCEGWSGPLIVFDQRDFERLQSSSSAAAAVEPSMSRTLEYRRFSDMKSAAQFLAETYESASLEQMMVDSRPSNEPSSTKVATPATPTDSTGTKKRKIATPESSVAAAAPPTVGRIAGEAVPSTTKSPVAIAGSYNRKQWEEGFQQLFQYKVKHGHCNPSATTSADDETRKIAEWIGIQRRRQKGTSDHLEPLCEEDVRKLNAIGFDWRRPSRYLGSGGANSVLPCPSPWEENFQKLLLYKSKHGHCNPSSKSKDEATRKIGIWVGTQRRRQNGTSRSLKPLSEEELRKLDAIGFDWRCPSKPKWDVRYQQLVKFKQTYGHCQVPREYEENPSLGSWCVTQRKRKRIKDRRQESSDINPSNAPLGVDGPKEDISNPRPTKKGQRSPMTDEQETKLLDLGFQF